MMDELDRLQGGIAKTGQQGDYGWMDAHFLWKLNIVRVIEDIYGEQFDDLSSDWGTDEGLNFLIQRAANNPGIPHRFPNLKYKNLDGFIDRLEATTEWYPSYVGMQFWCDVGEQGYHVDIRTLVPELEDESGVKIWAEELKD